MQEIKPKRILESFKDKVFKLFGEEKTTIVVDEKTGVEAPIRNEYNEKTKTAIEEFLTKENNKFNKKRTSLLTAVKKQLEEYMNVYFQLWQEDKEANETRFKFFEDKWITYCQNVNTLNSKYGKVNVKELEKQCQLVVKNHDKFQGNNCPDFLKTPKDDKVL